MLRVFLLLPSCLESFYRTGASPLAFFSLKEVFWFVFTIYKIADTGIATNFVLYCTEGLVARCIMGPHFALIKHSTAQHDVHYNLIKYNAKENMSL